ncbi:pseudouridine synthase [Ostreibacterium oceani]|uniref:Pseudouridine synthase n=1 Tax=Ostreibacterium oceani TaxID=2654998 RepID=A0A6N7EU05_9GAMM|nr:pseudouridine synthase [Ostreibacterium oceani]MPV85443.1 pseudouridine synthase [Ostreibacterium oceani]
MAKTPSKKATGERIQKKLAALGFGSRREIERLIEAGEVKVNNKPATLGQPLQGNELIQIKGRRVVLSEVKSERKTRVIAYHKPVGVLCTRKDDQGRPTVFKDLPPIKNSRWVMIGRLDANTSGLLLFTNDGGLANALMHPRNEVVREYVVRVFGEITETKLQQLESGIELDDGWAHFDQIIAISPDEEVKNNFFKVSLREGRNREVRRLWEAVECQVSRLKRVRYGSYDIPKTLSPGKTVELTTTEVKKLTQCLDASAKTSAQTSSRNDG